MNESPTAKSEQQWHAFRASAQPRTDLAQILSDLSHTCSMCDLAAGMCGEVMKHLRFVLMNMPIAANW